MTPEDLKNRYPEITLLNTADLAGLTVLLQLRGWLQPGAVVDSAAPAGEGNMNRTLRVHSGDSTIILKQSYPWVEKYPVIEAPWDRVIREARFYHLTEREPAVASAMPDLLWLDPVSRIAAFEDLGEAADFTGLYAGEPIADAEIVAVARWLSALHAVDFPGSDRESLTNRDMRALNHEHIFQLPLEADNGLDLDAITPGLSEKANSLKNDTAYTSRVQALGETYLADGPNLLHGDYFPGSWLRTTEGVRVIDPEFSFFGLAEFDAGVFLAHRMLAGLDDRVETVFLENYAAPAEFDESMARAFAGVEIMRRLIGVAQLPLTADGDRKATLLDRSRAWVLGE